MRKTLRLALLGLIVGPLLLAPPALCDDYDDVLEGFDDDARADPLDGFDDDAGEDDVFGGFEDDADSMSDDASSPVDRWWEITGSLSLGGSVNYLEHDAFKPPDDTTNWTGLSRLRTRMNLQVDLDIPQNWKVRIAGFGFYDWAYLINGRHKYTDEVLDLYEWEVDFTEFYVQGSPIDDLDLKVGRQVVNWGRSDSLRVLDVLNPLDNREPGLTDIEDIRRNTTMIRADYYFGDWSLQLVAVPELRFDYIPPVGSDFAPVLSSIGTVGFFTVPVRDPDESLRNTEWAVRLQGIFSGWDLSINYAYHWLNIPYLDPVITPVLPTPDDPLGVSFEGTENQFSRVHMVGSGANYTYGSWLIKSEIAWISGVDYTTSQSVDLTAIGLPVVDVPNGTVQKDRLDFMAGVEYYGFKNTTIALEIANRHIFDYQDDIRPLFGVRENGVETAIRITRTFMNERLEATVLGILFGTKAQDGSVVRGELSYDVLDGLEAGIGMIFYQNGDSPLFQNITKNDRIFFELKYSF